MNLWKKIKSVRFTKLLKFGFLLIQKPLLIIPIFNATQKTIEVSQALYGNAHQSTGPANAFRHALWNYFICTKTIKLTKNPQKSVFWCKKVTDFYENVSKNEEIDRAMDFHNNEIGRNLFLDNFQENETKMIDLLQKMTKNAQKIEKIETIFSLKNQLVYIH